MFFLTSIVICPSVPNRNFRVTNRTIFLTVNKIDSLWLQASAKEIIQRKWTVETFIDVHKFSHVQQSEEQAMQITRADYTNLLLNEIEKKKA